MGNRIRLQSLFDLVEICARKGVKWAVVSPGSRCAPLLIGFGRHPGIQTISAVDERSAAYLALGLAQETQTPVVLVSTSGTAAANYLPAVIEAWYQQVPLILLTADRPPEWIDQWDGQTIRQPGIYGSFVKQSFNFPVDTTHTDARWHAQRRANEAVNLALSSPWGPVHVNLPIREPFYPLKNEKIEFNSRVQIIHSCSGKKLLTEAQWQDLENKLQSFENILVVVGQQRLNPELNTHLSQVVQNLKIPVVADVVSNCHSVKRCIQSADLVFSDLQEDFKPQLLITLGHSLISKPLKLYFRKFPPQDHWHIGDSAPGDVFQALTQIVDVDPISFLNRWLNAKRSNAINPEYVKKFSEWSESRIRALQSHLNTFQEWNEFLAAKVILDQIPSGTALHLGNSMPVRVVNILGVKTTVGEIWSNRGTSGIDGTLSTAVGHTLANKDALQILLIGDLAFFYDRNGLWIQKNLPANLRIVLFNNSGGGIFKMIPGPGDQEGIEELFTTPHTRTGQLTAMEFGLEYQQVKTKISLESVLPEFLSPADRPKLLEISTDMEINCRFYKALFT
jgi:2-succinyl-5-enolpyruvyl-6-hydroxy-3-cyclohexene-1-carboxylate synthase